MTNSGPSNINFDNSFFVGEDEIPAIVSAPTVDRFISGDSLVRTSSDAHTPLIELVGSLFAGEDASVDFEVIGSGLEPVRVHTVLSGGEKLVSILRTENNRMLHATDSHTLLAAERVGDEGFTFIWKELSQLRRGDLLVTAPKKNYEDGSIAFEIAPVQSVVPAGFEPVYALLVDAPDEAFIANDFIHHIPAIAGL